MMKHRASNALLGRLPILKSGVSRREFLHDATAAAVFMAFGGFVRSALAQEMADIIFRGGPILTMNQKSPRAEALAIRGERILAVGSVADVDALRGTSTRSVDLAGQTLMPGQIDPHMHTALVQLDNWVDVGVITTPSYEAVLDQLRKAASEAQPGKWVMAQLFDGVITPGAHVPTSAELDALLPNNPLFMLESNGHGASMGCTAMQDMSVGELTHSNNCAITQLPENPESYQEAVAGVLSVIRNMATPIGANDPVRPNISATLWRTVSDMTNKRYYFEFSTMPNLVWIDLDKLNLKEGAPVQSFDMASDINARGEVSGKFQPTKPFEFYKEDATMSWKPTPVAH